MSKPYDENSELDELMSLFESQHDEIVALMLHSCTTKISSFRLAMPEHQYEMASATRALTKLFIDVIRGRKTLDHETIERVKSNGRAAAIWNIPIEDLIESFSISRSIGWQMIQKHGKAIGVSRQVLLDLADRLTRFMEQITFSVTLGYLEQLNTAYQQQHKELNALYTLAREVSRSLDPNNITQVALEAGQHIPGVFGGLVYVLSPSRDFLSLFQIHAVDEDNHGRLAKVAWGQGFIGESAADAQIKILPKAELSKDDPLSSVNFETAIALPLKGPEQIEGLIVYLSNETVPSVASSFDFISAVGDTVGVALNHIRVLREEVRTDPLTGLANRKEFTDSLQREIDRARRYHQPLSLILMDVDELKKINDSYGHLAGDEVLKTAGQLIRSSLRSFDIAARIGGDEFALVMPQTSLPQALHVADRFLQKVETYNQNSSQPFSLHVAIGAAQLEPFDTSQSLMARADKELYKHKAKNTN